MLVCYIYDAMTGKGYCINSQNITTPPQTGLALNLIHNCPPPHYWHHLPSPHHDVLRLESLDLVVPLNPPLVVWA